MDFLSKKTTTIDPADFKRAINRSEWYLIKIDGRFYFIEYLLKKFEHAILISIKHFHFKAAIESSLRSDLVRLHPLR